VKKDATKGGAHMPITMRSPAAGFDGELELTGRLDVGVDAAADDGVPGAAVPEPVAVLPGAADAEAPGEVIGDGDGVAAQPAARTTASASAKPGRRRDGCPTPRILRELIRIGSPEFL